MWPYCHLLSQVLIFALAFFLLILVSFFPFGLIILFVLFLWVSFVFCCFSLRFYNLYLILCCLFIVVAIVDVSSVVHFDVVVFFFSLFCLSVRIILSQFVFFTIPVILEVGSLIFLQSRGGSSHPKPNIPLSLFHNHILRNVLTRS